MAINASGMNFTSGLQYGSSDIPGMSSGNYNFGNTMNPTPTNTSSNPYGGITWNPGGGGATGGFYPGTPTVSPVPGQGGQSTSQLWNTLGLPTSGQGNEWDFARELAATYGKGTGSAIFQYLQRGGGYNSALTDQAVQAQTAAMQHQAQQGWGNIASQLGMQGIDPNSSVNALASSNYWSGVTAQENALAAQEYYNMWSQSSSQEASMLGSLLGGAQQHQQKKDSFWGDLISGGLGILSTAATGGFGGGIAGLFGGGD